MEQVADGVFFVEGSQVNWYLLREGDAVTVVDAGYPADAALLEASLEQIGASGKDVVAIVATHAHSDHIGSANHFHARFGTPLYTSTVEVPHARRDHLQQVTLPQVISRAWRPRVAKWARHAIAAGGTADVAAKHAAPFPAAGDDGALDLPGRPVPVPTPGHTSGHTAFLLPAQGALISGDALVTGHPVVATAHEPQLIPGFFQHDRDGAAASLTALGGLPADLLLPGHGRPWRGSMVAAIHAAAPAR